MSTYSKINIIYRLQKWMDSVPGQTFLNYAYSWGASVVILGTLFKLTSLPGANLMLFIGMGTEVFVFFLSAFDRPFDKTADGLDIPTRVTEEYLETGKFSYGKEIEGSTQEISASPVASFSPSEQQIQIPQNTLNTGEIEKAQNDYVKELNALVDTLHRVNEQNTKLTCDSEEMENLNRTLTGISRVYEMQLKGASQQMGTIDKINEQTQVMAQQIEQLNKVYARMIEAMTINMRAAHPQAQE